METNAVNPLPPETLTRKIVTSGLLALSVAANAIPVFFVWDIDRSANVFAWLLVMNSLLRLLPVWLMLCGMIALLAVQISSSRARIAIGIAIASLDLLALIALIGMIL